MKTRFIVAIMAAVIISGIIVYLYAQIYDCMNPPTWMKTPRVGFDHCWILFLNGYLTDWSYAGEYHGELETDPNPKRCKFCPKDYSIPTVIIPKGAVIDGHEMLIPKVITVVLGINNTVAWINEDDTAHGITSTSPDQVWGTSGILKPGETYSHTFNESGIFPYHGEPHPWMTGKVIVLEN